MAVQAEARRRGAVRVAALPAVLVIHFGACVFAFVATDAVGVLPADGRSESGIVAGHAVVAVPSLPTNHRNQYTAAPSNWLQHAAGGILYLSLGHDLDLGLRVDGVFGEDVSVLVLGSNLTWRPSW